MPIYEYLCKDCDTTYERLVRSSTDKIECPKCGSAKKELQFSVFASSKPNGSASASSSGAASSCACTPRSCGCH